MRKTNIMILFVFLMLLSGCSAQKEIEVDQFFCFTEDTDGHQIDGFYSEAEKSWILFLTSVQQVEDVVVYYEGEIEKASSGFINSDERSVDQAFTSLTDELVLTSTLGNTFTIKIMQSTLPSVYIDLFETTLDEIHVDKNNKFEGNSVYIYDPKGEADLVVENTVQIKGRGNTTWRDYEKKAYQIKFEEKTAVMGMEKAKKWVLMANSSDDSMIRTKLAYETAEQMDFDFVTGMEYVDLWIEGDYRGTFMIGEKVEPGKGRLELEHEMGALFEHDEAYYEDEDYWFYSEYLDRHFVLKEIENENYIENVIDDFKESVEGLGKYLYSTPSHEVTLKKLSEMIDVDSFAKYYIFNEYVLNCEAFATSFYWYKDGPEDVIHLGPLWDYDTCMGNDGPAYTDSYGDQHVLFKYLLAVPEFRERTMELYEQYKNELQQISHRIKGLAEKIKSSAQMNYHRWDVLGKPNPIGGEDFYPTFDKAVEVLENWLDKRKDYFKVAECSVLTSSVSESFETMEITMSVNRNVQQVNIAVWSEEYGHDDEKWYEAVEVEDGLWKATVDLRRHDSAGIYHMNAYLDQDEQEIIEGQTFIAEAKSSDVFLKARDINEDLLTIQLKDSNLYTEVKFAVWSDENGQDDLKWYNASRNEKNVWISEVGLNNHIIHGVIHIHAYAQEELIDYISVQCE